MIGINRRRKIMVKIVENENIAAFDIDDTLILYPHPDVAASKYEELGYVLMTDSYDKGTFYAKPSAIHIKLLKDYKARGFYNIVWSGNGYGHAHNILKQLNLLSYVDIIMTKPGRYVDDLKCTEWMGTHLYLEKGEWYDKA
jgi:hydroxymethylpyrimidine pyrophosphatase-like HAD family hydrolase